MDGPHFNIWGVDVTKQLVCVPVVFKAPAHNKQGSEFISTFLVRLKVNFSFKNIKEYYEIIRKLTLELIWLFDFSFKLHSCTSQEDNLTFLWAW